MVFALVVVAMEAMIAVVLFASAGRADLPWFWAVIVVHTATMMTIGLTIDPDLRRERVRPGPGGKDRWFRLLALPPILGHLVVAGLDVGRFGWSGPFPDSLHAAGL